MAHVLAYYAHPGQRYSRVNRAMQKEALKVKKVTFVDLYEKYPRSNIRIDEEQRLLKRHDVIVLQYPLLWYSCPPLVKEWIDLVLEYGFAYGPDGSVLSGKTLVLAVTAAGPETSYRKRGHHRFPLRSFLTPMEQTARFCGMSFSAPYVLYGALKAAKTQEETAHAEGFARLLEAMRDDRYDFKKASRMELVTWDTIPVTEGA